jgi:hypothetical protein
MKVKFRTNQGIKEGELVKNNKKTAWVKFDYKKNISKEGVKAIFKSFTAVIKRHKIKHGVVEV